MIVDLALKSLGPGAALAFALWLYAQRRESKDRPDALAILTTRLDGIESGVKAVSDQVKVTDDKVTKMDSEIVNVRERVARIEGKLDL